MRKKIDIFIVLILAALIPEVCMAVSNYDQDRAARILSKVNENIPGTMAASAEDAAGDQDPGDNPGEEPGLPGGGTLYVEVDIDFPWRNLKSALVQTAKYLTAQAKGEPEGTGGGTDETTQPHAKRVVVYGENPQYTGGVPEDETGENDPVSQTPEQESGGSGTGDVTEDQESYSSGSVYSYVSWVDAMMDTSKYFTAQTVFGGNATENDFYRLTGSGRGGGSEDLPPYTGGGVHEYDPGSGYSDDDLVYYFSDMRDVFGEDEFDFTGMSTDYIWHMSLEDIREGVNQGYVVETGDPKMPYAWRTVETDWFGNIKYVDRPVIEPANDSVTSFPSREYMGFGKNNTDEEIDDIIEDIESRTDDGTAVRSISDEELAEGLRKGTIKYVGDSEGSCLYMDTTSGTCVVDSKDPGTLGIISIANNALLGIVDRLYKPTEETVQVMNRGFDITRKLAVALVPLVILLSIASAMRAGASSVTGIAESRSMAVNLVFCIGLAFSSRWLLGKIAAISYSIAAEIGKGAILFSDSMLTSLTFGSAILIMLFTFVFIFIIIALLIEFYLAAMSLQVMYALLSALGPIFIVLSTFKPLEWLRGQWLKMLLQAVVLAPANALIINLLNHISWDGGASGVLLATGMYIGCASIMIAINSSVAKQILSSAAMVASKTADFIKGGFTGAGGLNLAGFAASGGFGALGTAVSHGGGSDNLAGSASGPSVQTGSGGKPVSPSSPSAGSGPASSGTGIPPVTQGSGRSNSSSRGGRNGGQESLFSTLLAGTRMGGGVAAANRLKMYNERKGYVKSSVTTETDEENAMERSFFRKYNNSVDVSDIHAIEERIRRLDTNHTLTDREVHNAADSASKMLAISYQGARNAGLDPMNGYQGDSMEQGAVNILDFGIARGVQMHAEYSGHAQKFLEGLPEGQRPGIDSFRRNEGTSYYEQGILIAGEFMESHTGEERNFGDAAAEVTDRLGQADLMNNIRW